LGDRRAPARAGTRLRRGRGARPRFGALRALARPRSARRAGVVLDLPRIARGGDHRVWDRAMDHAIDRSMSHRRARGFAAASLLAIALAGCGAAPAESRSVARSGLPDRTTALPQAEDVPSAQTGTLTSIAAGDRLVSARRALVSFARALLARDPAL